MYSVLKNSDIFMYVPLNSSVLSQSQPVIEFFAMYCSDIVGRLDLGQYQITPELDILVRREIVSPVGFAKLIYILSRMYYI